MCGFELALRADIQAVSLDQALAAIQVAVRETENAFPGSSIGWMVRAKTLTIFAIYHSGPSDHLTVWWDRKGARTRAYIAPGDHSRRTLMAAYNAAVAALRGLDEKGWATLEAAVAEARQPGVRQD